MVYASFDCYKGLDCKETITSFAKRKDMRPKEKEIEDPELMKPSAVEEVVRSFTGKNKDQSDDEEESTAAAKKKSKKKKKEHEN